MKVLLLNPPIRKTNDAAALRAADDGDNSETSIGLYLLAARLIESGFEVRLLNHALTPWNESLAQAAAFAPDLAGISSLTHNRAATLEWVRAFRKSNPAVRIVLGGVHATFLYEEILRRCREVDFVAVGEADDSLLELARRLEKGDAAYGVPGIASRNEDGSVNWPGPARPVEDLGALPIPSRHFDYSIVATARGCPFQCTFCSSPALWGQRVRERPVGHVIAELEALRRRGRRDIGIKDETFTLRAERVREVCEAMIDARLDLWWTCDTRADCLDEERLYWMRKAGCYAVSFGVESGSVEMLEAIRKKSDLAKVREATRMARRFGMLVRYYLIVGLPGETRRDLQATLDLALETGPHCVTVSALSVVPGTELCRQYREAHGLTDAMWFDRDDTVVLWDRQRKWASRPAGKRLLELGSTRPEIAPHRPDTSFTEDELREAVRRAEDAFATNYDLALFLMTKGRHEDAAPFYRRALEIRPEFSKGWLDLGTCLDRSGRLDEAVEAWERVEALGDAAYDNFALALVYRGLAEAARGRLDPALDLWRRAREARPEAVDPVRLIAERCAQAGRWDEAARAAETWAKVEPASGQAHHIVALCYMAQGFAEDAQALFEQALRLDPRNADAYNNYAVLLARLGQGARAAEMLETCLRLNPGHAAARALLAQLRLPSSS
ncbi:radical SAM protein [Candidatus Sumerlaeota bacterium]|nr:radical SAM protein [Candidatus Sumerlaeota bacterium]